MLVAALPNSLACSQFGRRHSNQREGTATIKEGLTQRYGDNACDPCAVDSLCSALNIGVRGGIKRVGLFERSEFRHAPPLSPKGRIKRGTGAFFWFVFLRVQENEQIN